jgi:hypothetical protein
MEVNIISQAPKLSGKEGEYISNTKLVSEACISCYFEACFISHDMQASMFSHERLGYRNT